LYGEGSDVCHFQWGEVVLFQQFIQTDREQFSDDADVFLEDDEVFDP
jgi:hypothetical protein